MGVVQGAPPPPTHSHTVRGGGEEEPDKMSGLTLSVQCDLFRLSLSRGKTLTVQSLVCARLAQFPGSIPGLVEG